MHRQLLVAGGGIGGLSAAIASSRAGWQVRLFEQAAQFSEVGAGVQLGPNATRLLNAWGLEDAVASVAAFPTHLQVRGANGGADIAQLKFGDSFRQKYGAPYITIHRADLHALLLQGAHDCGVQLFTDARISSLQSSSHDVSLTTTRDLVVEGDALVGADGLWSTVREKIWRDGEAQPTGHLAYRALVEQAALPADLRSNCVTAWLGPQMHVVSYPVRRGEWLNVVAFVHGTLRERVGDSLAIDATHWDNDAVAADLQASTAHSCKPLRALLDGFTAAGALWRLWEMRDREPVTSPTQMARGRVALLGDAAHPMRPYLAQGAGMAIEDAEVLARALTLCPELEVDAALSRYAALRWQRVAQVQKRARRNGEIFHMSGLPRVARDASLKLLGEKILDMPWLYGAKV